MIIQLKSGRRLYVENRDSKTGIILSEFVKGNRFEIEVDWNDLDYIVELRGPPIN